MNAIFNFEWGQKFTVEEVEQLSKAVGKKLELGEDMMLKDGWSNHHGDLTELFIIKPDLQIKVLGVLQTANLARLMVKLDNLNERLSQERQQVFNERCNVHVPGLGLMAIDEVKVVEDYCTEALQSELERGWRIIAACPQPDQRRPDYVLGRTTYAKH